MGMSSKHHTSRRHANRGVFKINIKRESKKLLEATKETNKAIEETSRSLDTLPLTSEYHPSSSISPVFASVTFSLLSSPLPFHQRSSSTELFPRTVSISPFFLIQGPLTLSFTPAMLCRVRCSYPLRMSPPF